MSLTCDENEDFSNTMHAVMINCKPTLPGLVIYHMEAGVIVNYMLYTYQVVK